MNINPYCRHASRLSIALALAGPLTAQQPPRTPAPPAPFVVHEWGTFTSMVGSDGVVLEGLQHEEERLPDFVHELAELEAAPGARALKFPATRVTQKMETPVIYFHTDRPRKVSVTVRFKQGLLTQFYPIPAVVAPPLQPSRSAPIDLTGIDKSLLEWQIDLIPYGDLAPIEIPRCAADDPWSIARNVRSAYVRTRDPAGIQREVEAEHYLFYRGLGRFGLPFGLRAEANGRGSFHNRTVEAVPYAAVLEVGPNGSRFQELGAVQGHAERGFSLGQQPWESDHSRAAADLGACVFGALVAEGLYEDEARAMIATWSRSWFQSSGTRVIYVLPRAEVDAVLPLRVHPQPDELVRVLVGRLEFIPPEREAEVEHALTQRVGEDRAAAQVAEEYLSGFDRFLEPHLRRASRSSNREVVRASAREVLIEIARNQR